VKKVCDEMIPLVAKKKLAKYVDVFCDRGAFTQEQSEKILAAARKHNLGTRAHVCQFTAAKLKPLLEHQPASFDHMDCVQPEDISLLARGDTLAVLLACVGIYGIMAYSVAQRTNEIGIRMALGAHRPLVMRMVLGEAAWMVATGVGVGLGAALLLTRTVASLLYGLKAWDPSTFALASALLLMAALGASWLPARRAAGVEPMQALRHE